MIFLGLDPGLANTGYGIIETNGSRSRHLAHGVFKTSPKDPAAQRLLQLKLSLEEVLEQYKPQAAGIETLFFAKNIRSALPVSEARGVLLVTLAQREIQVREFSPLEIKSTVTGVGRGEKHQVAMMVSLILGLGNQKMADHASDALAAALCLAQHKMIN